MNKISFFTPVCYEGEYKSQSYKEFFIEKIDSYLYFGGKRAKVISGDLNNKTREVVLIDSDASMFWTAIKVAFCFTIVLPITIIMLAAKAILRSNYDFILKEGKNVIPLTNNNEKLLERNRQLAKQIIADRGWEDKDVERLCSGNFLIDPTYHLIHQMIKRGVGRHQTDDDARAYVIGCIPYFIHNVSSLNYLRGFAKKHFMHHPKQVEIMKVFDKSFNNDEFQRDLKLALDKQITAIDNNNYFLIEEALRIPLTIFKQVESLKEYSYPEEANLE